jgi:hypothetical protein
VIVQRSPVSHAFGGGFTALLHAAAFLLLGSQALHHLRFLVAPDHDAGATLTEHGHGGAHLAATGPAIGIVVALLLAALIVRAAGAPRHLAARSVRVRRLWPLAVVALLVCYGSQELLEGALGHGHEGGFATLAENDGWVAVPLAVVLGGLIALAVRIARAADALVFGPVVRFVLLLAHPATLVRACERSPARPVFSLDGAGRGPPVVA